MISQHSQRFTIAWVLLLAITLIGYAVAENLYLQTISVAMIMLLSGYKARLILYQFMELGGAPLAFRVFFNCWLLVCVGMITGLFWAAT